MSGNLIRQHKIQDGINDALLAEVNSSKELQTKDTDVETAVDGTTTAVNAVETNQTDKSQMTQITDGTEELAINASNEATTHDADLLSQAIDIETAVQAVETNQTDKSQFTRITDGTDDAAVESSSDDTTDLNGVNGVVTLSVLNGRISSSEIRPLRIDGSTHAAKQVSYEHAEIHDNSHFFLEDYTTLGSADTLEFCITTDDANKWDHLTFKYSSSLLLTLDVYILTDWTANTGTLAVPFANNHAKTEWGSHTAGTNATVMTDSNAAFTVDALIGDKIYNVTDGSYGIITDNDATTITVVALVGGSGNDFESGDYYHINNCLTKIETDPTIVNDGMRIAGSKGGDGTNPSTARSGQADRDNEWVMDPNQNYLFRFTSGAAGNVISYNAEFYRHTDKD